MRAGSPPGRSGPLAAGERRGLPVEQRAGEPEPVQHDRRAGVQVGAAQGQPALQRHGVRVVGTGRAVGEAVGRGRQSTVGGCHAGTPGQVPAQRLPGAAVAFLGEQDDGRRAGRHDDRAGLGSQLAGDQREQRRLAHPVGSDDGEPRLRAHRDGDVGQHGVRAVGEADPRSSTSAPDMAA